MKGISEGIAETLKKYVDSSQERDLRLMAARGLIPLGPNELILVIYILTGDEDAEIASEARKSLDEMPRDLISRVLTDTASHPEILDYFARTSDLEDELQKIILNNSTDDDTISYLAQSTHSQELLELIANNHERIVRSSQIVEALSKNPLVSRSTLDGVIDYLRLYLGESADLPGPADDLSAQGPVEEAALGVEPGNSFLDSVQIDERLLEEGEEDEQNEPQEDEEVPNKHREHVLIEISRMTVGEKIKLAFTGNREARSTLIRDPNRIVSRAALKNPRLTDTEIVSISQSKIVSEDILREISENRRWTKMYPVKLALVNNPKTPLHISVNLIKQLRDFDLRSLRWSKNLPGVITKAAKQIMQERKDRK